jgi:hypothetical protein
MNKENVADFTVGDKVTLSLTDDRTGMKTTYLGKVREALGHGDYLAEVVLDNGHAYTVYSSGGVMNKVNTEANTETLYTLKDLTKLEMDTLFQALRVYERSLTVEDNRGHCISSDIEDVLQNFPPEFAAQQKRRDAVAEFCSTL